MSQSTMILLLKNKIIVNTLSCTLIIMHEAIEKINDVLGVYICSKIRIKDRVCLVGGLKNQKGGHLRSVHDIIDMCLDLQSLVHVSCSPTFLQGN